MFIVICTRNLASSCDFLLINRKHYFWLISADLEVRGMRDVGVFELEGQTVVLLNYRGLSVGALVCRRR